MHPLRLKYLPLLESVYVESTIALGFFHTQITHFLISLKKGRNWEILRAAPMPDKSPIMKVPNTTMRVVKASTSDVGDIPSGRGTNEKQSR